MAFCGSPTYSVKFYRDGLYKLIKFKRCLTARLPEDREQGSDRVEGKYAQAISRAKSVIYQVAVCNDWDFFVTFTIDRTKFDRYEFKPFYKSFSQWIRDHRKKYGSKIEYLLIPEQHEDGAWHMHGFMRGIPQDQLSRFVLGVHPQRLCKDEFWNWGLASKKFGYCSLSEIRDPMGCAAYACKYVTKELLETNTRFGAHLYMCSIGLRRAVRLGYVYGSFLALDRYLSDDNEFTRTGWVRNVPWHYFFEWIHPDSIPHLPDFPDFYDIQVDDGAEDPFVEFGFDQLKIAGWTSG